MLRMRSIVARAGGAVATSVSARAHAAAVASVRPIAAAAALPASAACSPSLRLLHTLPFRSSDKPTDSTSTLPTPAGATGSTTHTDSAPPQLSEAEEDAPVRQSLALEEGEEEDEEVIPTEEEEEAMARDDDEGEVPTNAQDEVDSDEINELLGGGDGEDGEGEGGTNLTDPTADVDDDASEPVRQNLKPSELVSHLDKYIVGQFAAKKSVAVALRNRWRRHSVRPALRQDITPKNILMVGPTGCGKTEIARRLALITDSPFIKVEATKFTEVGFYGKDVDTIIRDLVRVAINNLKSKKREQLAKVVGLQVENTILQALHETRAKAEQAAAAASATGVAAGMGGIRKAERPSPKQVAEDREALRKGELDSVMIDIDVPLPKAANPFGDILGGGGAGGGAGGASGGDADDDLGLGGGRGGGGGGGMSLGFAGLGGMKGGLGAGMERRHMSIGEARPLLTEHHLVLRIRTRDLAKQAIKQVESDGIVFLDEVDKICTPKDSGRRSSADASDEGVQRDLLPLVEGTTVTTPHGPVQTDHILFICSGAFHKVNVADMLPELQGRLPIRVELQALTEEDFYRILTVPTNNLIKQQVALLSTDNVQLNFTDAAIREVARVSFEVNRTVENIGARRLNTVIQRVMDEHSFTAADQPAGTTIEIDVDYVRERIKPLVVGADLKRFVL